MSENSWDLNSKKFRRGVIYKTHALPYKLNEDLIAFLGFDSLKFILYILISCHGYAAFFVLAASYEAPWWRVSRSGMSAEYDRQ